MKKIIALILAVIMMFSMTSVSYAADTAVGTETSATTTIDNYMNYLEEKLEDDGTNFFVKIVIRVVIIFVFIGFIDVEDFDDWFENTAPDIDTDTDNDNTTEDNNSNNDWVDGTEVKLHHSQALPYTQNGITITDIKITKEHYNNIAEGDNLRNYKYNVFIEGKSEKNISDLNPTLSFDNSDISYRLSRSLFFNDYNFTINDEGDFTLTDVIYSNYDFNYFIISNV